MVKKTWIRLFVTLIFMVLLSSICGAAETGVTVGKNMPQFTLTAIDGNSITVAPTGKVTVINFWATWCPPCRGEMPELNEYYLQNSDKVAFYTVNLGESEQKAANFIQRNNYSLPVLLDLNNDVARQFSIQYIPTTLVMDKEGIIQFRTSGAVTKAQLEEIVEKL
ncbi:MAG: Redoxin domain protein [Firmicutes bacterium]|nr:Redoxin domain protein [Bacillota bacterium]